MRVSWGNLYWCRFIQLFMYLFIIVSIYFTILYCIVIVLHYTIVYHIISYHIISYHIMLYYLIVLYHPPPCDSTNSRKFRCNEPFGLPTKAQRNVSKFARGMQSYDDQGRGIAWPGGVAVSPWAIIKTYNGIWDFTTFVEYHWKIPSGTLTQLCKINIYLETHYKWPCSIAMLN